MPLPGAAARHKLKIPPVIRNYDQAAAKWGENSDVIFVSFVHQSPYNKVWSCVCGSLIMICWFLTTPNQVAGAGKILHGRQCHPQHFLLTKLDIARFSSSGGLMCVWHDLVLSAALRRLGFYEKRMVDTLDEEWWGAILGNCSEATKEGESERVWLVEHPHKQKINKDVWLGKL